MSQKKIHIFFLALAALFCLCSCGLEEPIDTPQNSDGYVEFVARPVGFNNQVVDTKATASGNIETGIYSCYFLVFDTTPSTGNGNLVYCSDNLISGTDPVTSIPTQKINVDKKTVKKVKACFIVNVPKNFIYNETNNTPLINNLTSLNAAVLGPEHFSYATHGDDVPMGTPQMTINGATNVKCLPAFGMTPSDISLEGSAADPVQISVKRLFAKMSINLKVALDLSDFENAIQTLTHYELQTLKLYNLPTKVKLVEDSDNESAWRSVANQYNTTPMQKSGINTDIYNNSGSGYSYSFYVPEFYLNPIANANQAQEYKPKNYPNTDEYRAYPVYIQIEGNFVKYAINSATINYRIFLGGDNIDNFSIARNTHYSNDLTIQNTNKNDQDQDNLDHRVNTTTINNPVAKAGKAANCYVISQPGDYHFPAYMGAYNDLQHAIPCEGGVDVEILVNKAQYEGYGDITSINISNETYDPVTNMISFSVASAPIINVVPNGNVVIALVDKARTDQSRKIIWSWHLWFCTDFSAGNESEWATIGSQTYPNNKQMMDRNLGATVATSATTEGLGLYYRFNNKNPYLENAYIGGGINGTATFNPAADSNANDNTKAVHDPCPPGYRVPKLGTVVK